MDARTGLLDAALTLFAARGYDAVGVQEIVEAAGVTKPTLYHHFGNKQRLLDTLIAERLAPLDAAVREACESPEDLPRTLDGVVAAYLGFAAQRQELYQLWLSMNLAPPGSVPRQAASASLARHRGWLEGVFQAAVGRHGDLRDRHPRLAMSLIGLVNAYAALAWEDALVIDDGVIHEVVRRFLHGVYA